MMITGIHHVAISTPDIDRLMAFYRDVIGFEVVYDGGWDEPIAAIDAMMELDNVISRVVMMRTGTGFLELFQFSSPEPQPGDPRRPVINHGITHLALNVTDAKAEYERLKAAGMAFHCPPIESGMPVTGSYGRDPDGNVIEILEIRDEDWPFHFANRRLKHASATPSA